jgi:hypothetical protein
MDFDTCVACDIPGKPVIGLKPLAMRIDIYFDGYAHYWAGISRLGNLKAAAQLLATSWHYL